MKRLRWALVLLLVFGFVFCIIYYPRRELVLKGSVSGNLPRSETQPESTSSKTAAPKDNAKNGLKEWLKELEARGLKITPGPDAQLSAAIVSHDKDQISRAFNDVLNARYSDDKLIPIFKSLLVHKDAFVRYSAARSLYFIGNGSGYSQMLEIINSPVFLEGRRSDLRIDAAGILTKYRVSDASESIIALYERTQNDELLSNLATIGVAVPELQKFAFVSSTKAITEYAKISARQFLPQITETFKTQPDERIKAASAWALASMTGENVAVSYLREKAQEIVDIMNLPSGGSSSVKNYQASVDSIRFLGTIQNADAKKVLEASLKSKDIRVREIATVNLIFNQGGSKEASELVAQSFQGGSSVFISVDLALRIAAAVNDPIIKAGGEKFGREGNSDLWHLYSVQRKQWPIYNWIDDYVVGLNQP